MPQELDRIKELAGLQQEAEPQDTADNLISTVTKLAQDALEKSNFDLQPFRPLAPKIQKLVTIKSPNYDGSQADALYNIWNTYPTKNSDPKDTTNIAYHMKELISIGRNYLKLPPYNFDKFEKPALTAQQKQGLAVLVKKYANRKTYGGGGLIDGYLDYLAQTGVWTDAADEKEFDVALKKLGHDDLDAWEQDAEGEEFEQFLKLAPITGQAQNDVAKVLGKGFENNEELISAASDYVRSLPESAVAEAPGADINNSTMPSELDRIRELSGLQQEAAVSLKGKESALKAWYNKYSKYTGGNGDPLPFGLIKAYTESGIISDGYEENELAKAEKALGKKEGDWEDQDWQKVYSMTPITQGMERDLLTATGSKTVDEELLAKVYDVIEDMYPSYDQVLGKKESAVAEAPASGDQALANELSRYFAKLAKEMLQNMQRPNTNDVEYEEFVDIAQAFKGGIQAGLDEVNLSRFEFSSNPFGDFGRSINDGPDEELVKILAKHGYRPGPDGDNDEATIVKQQEETAVQPMPVLNAVKETSVTSQVDEAIKKATAQLKSFSNFDGLKPYKPKKK